MGMAFHPGKLMPRSEAGTEGESQSNKDQFYIFNDCNELGGFKITVCRLMMAVLFFLLEYNCFTRLCSCLQHKQVNQPYVYVYPRPLGPPHLFLPHPSGSSQNTELSTSGLFYTLSCAYVSPDLPGRPTLLSPPCVHVSILYIWVSIPALQVGSSVPFL